MEEYKKDLTEKLQAEKIEAAKTADEDKVVAKVIENRNNGDSGSDG